MGVVGVAMWVAAQAGVATATATATSALPPPAVSPPAGARSGDLPMTTIDVVLTVGRETLWSGPLRLGTSGASYSQSLRESEAPCPTNSARNGDSRQFYEASRQLSVNLNRRGSPREQADAFSISVRWQRPIPVCEGSGNRSISLDQVVDVTPGQTVRVTGDAGLVVVLTRRAQ